MTIKHNLKTNITNCGIDASILTYIEAKNTAKIGVFACIGIVINNFLLIVLNSCINKTRLQVI